MDTVSKSDFCLTDQAQGVEQRYIKMVSEMQASLCLVHNNTQPCLSVLPPRSQTNPAVSKRKVLDGPQNS